MHKVVASAEEAIHDVFDGAAIMVGGFGDPGLPGQLLEALRLQGAKNLTVVHNGSGGGVHSLGGLIHDGKVKKLIASFPSNPGNQSFQEKYLKGEIELELVPQGTLAERIRAAGAGIPAFFTPTGVGTLVAEGKEAREFDGRTYIMERALKADFAFVKAWKGDRWGNLVYRKTARNFNPMMATAAKVTIAEVEHLVEPGELDPDLVHTPSVYVQRIFQGQSFEKRIEKRTPRKGSD